MSRRRLAALLALSCAIVVAHLVAHVVELSSDQRTAAPYELDATRRSHRVVLVVLDSLPLRVATDPALMPRLVALAERGASGVLWAPTQTSTQQGIIALATGSTPSAVDYLRLFSDSSYPAWTLFEDLRARGEAVSFKGEHKWVDLFGRFGTGNHPTSGQATTFFEEDLGAVRSASASLASTPSPALVVLHVVETDFIAHQVGTRSARYAEVVRRWDALLGDFVDGALDGRTTLVITSDHGCDELGSHGGDGEVYRRVPVVFVGEGIRRAHGFEMNAVDMPATLAVLLGTRLPGAALAAPATAPLDLEPGEASRILLGTYDHLLATTRDAQGASTRAQRRATLARLDPRSPATADAARAAIRDLLETLAPRRVASLGDVGWTLLVFLAAAALGAMPLVRHGGGSRARGAVVVWGALVTQALLVVRFGFAPELKRALAWALAHHLAAFVVTCAGAASAGWALARLRRRFDPVDAIGRHPLAAVTVAFLAVAALTPLTNVALLFTCLLALCLYRARLPRAHATAAFLVFLAYFAGTSAFVLPHLGESPTLRYAYGLGAAAVGAAWIVRGPLAAVALGPRLALVTLLALFPFGGLYLPTADPRVHAAVAVLAVAALAAVARARGAAWLIVLELVVTAAFVVFPSPAFFFVALACPAVVLAHGFLRRTPPTRAAWFGRLTMVVSAMIVLSKPEHVPSLVALYLVLAAIADMLVDELEPRFAIGLAAAAIVCAHGALFDLFGNLDRPAVRYDFTNLDLGVGLLGGENVNLARGAVLIVGKMVLAAVVAFAALFLARSRAKLERPVVATAAAFTLIQVADAALKVNLSFGELTARFEPYLVSLFIHTVLFVTVVLGYAALRGLGASFGPEDSAATEARRPAAPLVVDQSARRGWPASIAGWLTER